MKVSPPSPHTRINVRVTERGLPIAIKLARGELTRDPMELARDILLSCQVSAMRQQVARRRDLAARGFGSAVIRGMNLSTEEELARAEAELRGDGADDLPDTWMKRA